MANVMVKKPKLYFVVRDKKTGLPKLRPVKREQSTYKLFNKYALDVEKRLYLTKGPLEKVDIVKGTK